MTGQLSIGMPTYEELLTQNRELITEPEHPFMLGYKSSGVSLCVEFRR
jgi:hypothetical protein